MGTKRGASPILTGVEEQESKKQNMENRSFGSGENGEEKTVKSAVDEPIKNGGTGTNAESNKAGDVSEPSGSKTTDNVDPELKKIRDDVKKLKMIAKSQRDELREGIMSLTTKLGEMFIAHAATATSANFYGDFMEELSGKLTDSELREKDRDRRIDDIALSTRKTKSNLNELGKEVSGNTQARKSGNLALNGVPEKENENCIEVATTYLKHIDPEFKMNQLVNAYRLGKKGGSAGRYRTLLVKFKDPAVKEAIVKQKTVLQNKKELARFHCNEDLPQATRKVRQEMREIAKFALKNGYNSAKVSGNKLIIDDKTYYEDELYLLPPELQLANIKTRPIGGGIGFQSEHSYLSNFFPCTIRMHENVFVSAEQAYFFHKSIVCERESVGIALKEMTNPSTFKSKGDKIPTCETWENVKVAVMRNILLQKFTQNPVLKAKLMGTCGSPLLECTNNKFWGTGWYLDDPMWEGRESYPGKNTLRTLLEGIRDGFDEVILNSTAAIVELQPMDMGKSPTEGMLTNKDTNPVSTPVPETPKTTEMPHAPPTLTEGRISVARAKKPAGVKPTAQEISKSIVPTLLDNPQGGGNIENSKKASTRDTNEGQSPSDKEGSVD